MRERTRAERISVSACKWPGGHRLAYPSERWRIFVRLFELQHRGRRVSSSTRPAPVDTASAARGDMTQLALPQRLTRVQEVRRGSVVVLHRPTSGTGPSLREEALV
jgi:hypothetical protein